MSDALLLPWLLLACQTESPTARKVDAMVDALQADDATTTTRGCAAIEDADLADQCQVESVRRHVTTNPASCLALHSPVWRDECLFLVAENTVKADKTTSAQALCSAAGEYQEQCTGHLLNARMSAALSGCSHPVDCMARDRALVDALAAMPGVGPRKAWADYFQQGLHRGANVTLSACSRAGTPADRSTCEDAIRAYVYRVTLYAVRGPDSTPTERLAWCAADTIPAQRTVDWFDHGDAALAQTQRLALRFACLPATARDAIPLGWNRITEKTPQVRQAIATDDPRPCEQLRTPFERRRCRDAVYTRRYQAACDAAPSTCMAQARPIVSEAAAWSSGANDSLAREWSSFFFQHAWRQPPFMDCQGADDPATCVAATRQAADRLVVCSLHDNGVPTDERARLCAQGEPAIRARLPMLDGVPVEPGLALACASDAGPPLWPWDPGYRDATPRGRHLRPPSP